MCNNQTKITFNEAKKKLIAMNLINNFLWNSATEDEEDAKTIASIILSNVLNAKVEVMDVTIQKEFSGLDTASVTASTHFEDATKQIIFNRKHKIPDSETRQEFIDNYDFDEDKIDALFAEASKQVNS